MREAAGAHVALLTQDAEPADEHWLERLLEGFSLADDVAIAYGPYRPRGDASPAVRVELERWFQSLSPGGATLLERLDADERRSPPLGELIGRRGFFTDANACLARAAWERVPFREVSYAEDRVLAIDMLRAGYAKAFVPQAAVLHSHALHDASQQLRRSFDEWRGLLEVYGWREPAAARHLLSRLRGAARAGARRAGRRAGLAACAPDGTRSASPAHQLASLCGALLGSRADRLPPRVRRRLSLERRAELRAAAHRGVRRRLRPRWRRSRPGAGAMSEPNPLEGRRQGPFSNLRRRIYLTYTHFGLRTLLFRLLTFPLRFTPLQRAHAPAHARTRPGACAGRASWYRAARPARRRRDPELPRRRARAHARAQHREDRARGDGPRDRRRRLQRRRAPRRAARDRRDRRARRVRAQQRLRGERQPRHRGKRPRARRGRAELRHRGAAGLARVPAVRRLRSRGRRRHRRRAAAVPGRADPVRRDRAQSRSAAVVRPSLPLQAARLGAGRMRRARRSR